MDPFTIIAIFVLIGYALRQRQKAKAEREVRLRVELKNAALLAEIERQGFEFRSAFNNGLDLHVH
jgi:hypothetical protein